MPTYDYICKNCKHELEIFQSMTEAPKKKCPECGKNTLERQIGIGAAVMFKGSGFYETDYRSESYKKAQAADAEKSKPTDGKTADAKSDAKADPKTDSKAESKPDSNAVAGSAPKAPPKVGTSTSVKPSPKPASKPSSKSKRKP